MAGSGGPATSTRRSSTDQSTETVPTAGPSRTGSPGPAQTSTTSGRPSSAATAATLLAPTGSEAAATSVVARPERAAARASASAVPSGSPVGTTTDPATAV